MTGKHLPPRYDLEDARTLFLRRKISNLFGLLRRRPARVDESGHAASLELVWMPARAYRFAMTHKGKDVFSWVTVDASFGGFALLGRVKEIVEGNAVPGEVLDPVLDEERTEELAREGVVRYILRTRGAKPSVDDITDRFEYHAPVWVYYYRRAGNKLDLAVLDAYSGDPMGGLVKRAVLDAFIARRRAAKVETT